MNAAGDPHPKRIDNDSHLWGNGAVLPGLRFLPMFVCICHGITDKQYDYCVKEIMPVVMKLKEEGKIRFTAMSERFQLAD